MLRAALFFAAASACTTNLECYHNGVCRQSQCVCHAAWTGPACAALKQGVSTQLWPNPAHALPPNPRVTDSWGVTVGRADDGAFHAYFCVACVFNATGHPQPFSMHSSGIVAARAPALEGPYELVAQFEGVFSEGPHMTRTADGRTWVLITPSANASSLGPVTCTGEYGPAAAPLLAAPLPGAQSTVNKSSLFSAPSPGGPWLAHNFSLAQSNIQTYFSNPSLAIGPEGEGLLAWRVNLAGAQRGESIAYATAPTWDAPLYTALVEPLQPGLTGVEDPFLWRHNEPSDVEGVNVTVLSILFHAQTSELGAVGGLFVSVDQGRSWLRSPTPAYGTTVPDMVGQGWPGGPVTFARRERPELHFDEATGQPTHLLTGVMLPKAGPQKDWQLSYSIATRLG
jgi:hypothetical protein